MTNVAVRFREWLTGALQVVQDELDQLVAAIQGTWNVEHDQDGTHAAITCASLTTAGAIRATGIAPIGYGVGAGSTVTQGTSKSTGITLNKVTGQITLHNAALAADTTVSFALTNATIVQGDLVLLNHVSGGTAGSYLLNARTTTGSVTIDVRNITAGSLSEAIVIGFAVLKAGTT